MLGLLGKYKLIKVQELSIKKKLKSIAREILPKYINIFGVFRRVYLHVPAVLRCFRCQRLGHRTHYCNNIKTCARCGTHHRGDCKSEPFCISCTKAHSTSSKDCIFVQFHKEVNATSTYLNISKSQAIFLAKPRYQQKLSPSEGSDKIEIELSNPYLDTFTANIIENTNIIAQSELASQLTQNVALDNITLHTYPGPRYTSPQNESSPRSHLEDDDF